MCRKWLARILDPLVFIRHAFAVNVFGSKEWQNPDIKGVNGNDVLVATRAPTSNFAYWSWLGIISQVPI